MLASTNYLMQLFLRPPGLLTQELDPAPCNFTGRVEVLGPEANFRGRLELPGPRQSDLESLTHKHEPRPARTRVRDPSPPGSPLEYAYA